MLRIATTFWLFQGIFGLSSISAFAQSAGVDVVITTSSGDIRVNVDTVRAPVTAANFLRYVDGDLYADGAFFRTVRAGNQPEDSVRIAVVQGGASSDNRDAFFDPVPLERTSGMDVVRAVHQSPADGQSLSPSIRILYITRE